MAIELEDGGLLVIHAMSLRDRYRKAKRRRVGRPLLAGQGASPRMSFRTTPDLYQAAQKRAKKEGRSVSDLAREAVARYVGS